MAKCIARTLDATRWVRLDNMIFCSSLLHPGVSAYPEPGPVFHVYVHLRTAHSSWIQVLAAQLLYRRRFLANLGVDEYLRWCNSHPILLVRKRWSMDRLQEPGG
nr:uncharacterized protein LOC114826028 [Malus domestica]